MGLQTVGEEHLAVICEGDPIFFPPVSAFAVEFAKAFRMENGERRPIEIDLCEMDAESSFAHLRLGAIAVDHEQPLLDRDQAGIFGSRRDRGDFFSRVEEMRLRERLEILVEPDEADAGIERIPGIGNDLEAHQKMASPANERGIECGRESGNFNPLRFQYEILGHFLEIDRLRSEKG